MPATEKHGGIPRSFQIERGRCESVQDPRFAAWQIQDRSSSKTLILFDAV